MSRGSLIDVLDRIGTPRVLVLGDVMLDRYTWGDAERVSPEAPVLVFRVERQEVRPGGAASVAILLRALGASVRLAGVAGNDADGQALTGLLAEARVETSLLLADPDRATTSKERFVGRAACRHPHQVLRVDREQRQRLPLDLETRLEASIRAGLNEVDALRISDYGKGVCSAGLLKALIPAAVEHGIPVFVDPARGADCGSYQGASGLLPNRVEAQEASGRLIDSPRAAVAVAEQLRQRFRIGCVLVKLDREGIAVAKAGNSGKVFETRPRDVYDVTGAGDMVLAVAGLCRASAIAWEETIELANVAAGLEVERFGVTPVSRDEIRAELTTMEGTPAKLVTAQELAGRAERYRQSHRTVVFTNGCFDLLHIGHVSHLQAAAALGDVLVVALNSDRSVRRLKGEGRPIIKEAERAALVAALGCVDHVLIFEEDTPHNLLRLLCPEVLVKGGDYGAGGVVGREIVESCGGKVCITGQIEGVSTTRVLASVWGRSGSAAS